MTMIGDNLQRVQARLVSACQAAHRDPSEVGLLAVSKTFGPDIIRQAFIAGQHAFGENYIQEGVEKVTLLADLPIEWHMVGPVQSNKTRLVAAHFSWMHTVDRLKIAQRLDEQRPAGLAPLNVCIQVNVDGGGNKAGVAPAEVPELALAVAAMPRLRLRGLMTIPEPAASFEAQVAVHRQARVLFESVGQALSAAGLAAGGSWDTLSMGMSADLEAAVQAGSTLVRVGSAIFGAR
jgi:hypothetical protein